MPPFVLMPFWRLLELCLKTVEYHEYRVSCESKSVLSTATVEVGFLGSALLWWMGLLLSLDLVSQLVQCHTVS